MKFLLALFVIKAFAGLSMGGAVQGTLLAPGGKPVLANGVNFKVQVLDKTGTCVLYEESQLGVDLSQTNGDFSFDLGSGTSRVNFVSNTTALDVRVYRNDVSPLTVTGCASLTLTPTDERKLRVQFDVGGGMVTLSPDLKLQGTAYAAVAATLEGKTPADLLQVNYDGATNLLNQNNLNSVFSGANYPSLTALLAGTSTQYLSTSGTAPLALNVVAPGTSPFNAVNKGYADANVAGHAIDASAVGAGVGGGSTIVWDQAQAKWVAGVATTTPSGPAGGDLTGAYPNPTIKTDAITSAKISSVDIAINRLLITNPTDGNSVVYANCLPNEILRYTTNGWQCTTVATLAPVVSVAGKTGAVSLNAADIGGLGTVVTKDFGSSAGQIPILDGSARLPASVLPADLAKTGGGIGIGTSTPLYKLQVAGGSAGLLLTTTDFVPTTTGSSLALGEGAATGNTFSFVQANNTGGSLAAPLSLNPYGGNVGVATIAPKNKFEIFGTFGITPAPTYLTSLVHNGYWNGTGFPSLTGGPGAYMQMYGGASQDSGFGFWVTNAAQADPADTLQSYVEALHIDRNARVGIGTSAPQAGLDIATTGSASALLVPRDTTAARPSGVNGMIRYNTSTGQFEGYGGTWQNLGGAGASVWAPGSTAGQIHYDAGNVGIGTGNPDSKLALYDVAAATLHVTGGDRAELKLSSQGTGARDWSLETGNTAAGLSGAFRLSRNGSDFFHVDQFGYVGIGTPTPYSLMHVKGGTLQVEAANSSQGIKVSYGGFQEIWSLGVTDNGGTALMGKFQLQRPDGAPVLTALNNGSIGIGTSSPTALLHVEGGNSGNQDILLKAASSLGVTGNGSDVILKAGNASSDIGGNITLTAGGGWTKPGSITLATQAGYGGSVVQGGNIYLAPGAQFGTYGNTVLNQAGGRVGIGTDSPSQKLHVVGNIYVQGTLSNCTLGDGSGGTSCSSDARLKDHIREIENPLEKIMQLRGVEFEWKATGAPAIGVIAQDVERQFPTAVTEDPRTGYKKVDYAVLVAPLIQAIKELKKNNDDLRAQNAAIRAYLCAKDPGASLCRD